MSSDILIVFISGSGWFVIFSLANAWPNYLINVREASLKRLPSGELLRELVHPVRNVLNQEYALQHPARLCDKPRRQQRQTKDHNGPREPAWEVDDREAIFAKSDKPSNCSDNQRTDPFGCPPGPAGSKSKTRPSRCRDQSVQDVETCPGVGCGLYPTRENFCGTQPHATRDPARTPGALPRAETSPPREKLRSGL